MKRSIFFVLLMLFVAQGFAQGDPKTAPPAVRIGSDLNGYLRILSRDDVRADIGFSKDQGDKLSASQKELMTAIQQVYKKDTNLQKKESQEEAVALQNAHNARVEALLTADQLKRLKEIDLQLMGNVAAGEPEISKALGLSEEQVAKIQTLRIAHGNEMKNLFKQMRERQISPKDVQAAMKKIGATLDQEVGKVLTAEQAAKLKQMGGKTFVPAAPPSDKGS